MTGYRALLTLAALASVVTACSSQPSPDDIAAAKETAALAPLRSQYEEAVTGFDIKGNELVVAINLNAYADIDQDDVPRLQEAVVEAWRSAWLAQHPGKHAELTIRFIDYHGTTFLRKKIAA